jgi:integrase
MTFDKRATALAWARDQERDLRHGAHVDPRDGRTTVATYAARWQDAAIHWRPTTRERVAGTMRHVLAGLGERQLATLRRTDVQSFVASLDLAPSTTALTLRHLRAMLACAVDDGLIAKNPATAINVPRDERPPIVPLTSQEIWALADAAPPTMRSVILLAAGTGVRQGEALGLSVDRVDFLRRTVRVDRQVVTVRGAPALAPPKTSASVRTVPAPSWVLDELAAHLKVHGEGPERLLFHTEGRPVRRITFASTFRQTALRAARTPGLERLASVHFHDARHAYASALIASGVSVVAVAAALGHSSPRMTLSVYAHLWPSDTDRVRTAAESIGERPADKPRTAGHV